MNHDDNKVNIKEEEIAKIKQETKRNYETWKYMITDCKPEIRFKTPTMPKNYEEMIKMKSIKHDEIKREIMTSMPTLEPELNEEELNELENKLREELIKVRDMKEKLYFNKVNCITCKEREKNVIISDCGHLSICVQCEKQLQDKMCPQCFKPYKAVVIINL